MYQENQETKNNKELRHLAKRCNTVIEIGEKTTAETTALLAGQPANMLVYSHNPVFEEIHKIKGTTNYAFHKMEKFTYENAEITECDLLLINPLKYNLLYKCHANVNKWIALKSPGNLDALLILKRFLEQHPEWFVIYHNTDNMEKSKSKLVVDCTLTILSRIPTEKSILPIMPQTVSNNYKESMSICNSCPFKRQNRCAISGGYLGKITTSEKITWVSNACPIVMAISLSSSSLKKFFV